ncbi:MAG: hypothetical protein K6E34_14845 [Lachnospiraceae bacterium]|nr:hypothetical protein [Lachnospiraceae bacterium]
MTREEFINYLVEHDIPFYERTEMGLDTVYILDKKIFNTIKNNPDSRTFLPYLRVSGFDKGTWYTRDCGDVGYKSLDWIMNRVNELGA